MTAVSTVMRAGAIPCRYASLLAQRAPLPQKVGAPSGLKKETRTCATVDDPSRMTPLAPTDSARVQRRRTRSGKSSRLSVPERLSNRMKSLPAADILKNSICGGVMIVSPWAGSSRGVGGQGLRHLLRAGALVRRRRSVHRGHRVIVDCAPHGR